MPGPARLIFHIGLEKTGSTSFQRFCSDHRSALRRGGTLYPSHPLCTRGPNHAPLVASYFSAEEAGALLIAGRRADRADAVAALKREIAEAATSVTLVSEEHFSSRFSRPQIAALAEDFNAFSCEIALAVRAHAARALSAYATTIASGRSLTLDEFIRELCEPANPYLRYRRTILPWEEAFGPARVFAYREGQDIVAELAKALLPQGMAGEARYWLNASDSAADLERARQRNASGQRAGGLLVGRWVRTLRERLRVGPPAARTKLRLNDDQSRRIEEIAAPDRAWLFERYGVSLD